MKSVTFKSSSSRTQRDVSLGILRYRHAQKTEKIKAKCEENPDLSEILHFIWNESSVGASVRLRNLFTAFVRLVFGLIRLKTFDFGSFLFQSSVK